MAEKQKAQLRRKWKRWIETIGYDLGNCLTSKDIHEEIRHIIIVLNKRIQAPSLLYNWLVDNYVDSITVRIRRLTDHDKRCISLYRLIEDILRNREAITRYYYISQYPKWMQKEGFADRDFDNFANKGSNLMSEYKLRKDMKRLDKNTDCIKKFVNKWIAHCDLQRKRLPARTHKDVDISLESIDGIFCKYNLLVTRGGMRTARPALQFDWKEPLRHAWIKDDKQKE
jgi:hypothetical protein